MYELARRRHRAGELCYNSEDRQVTPNAGDEVEQAIDPRGNHKLLKKWLMQTETITRPRWLAIECVFVCFNQKAYSPINHS